MKRKIIFLVLCVVLLLIFTSLSYGWGPNPIRIKEHPEQEFLSPPRGERFDDVLLVIIPNWNGFSLALYVKSNSAKENPPSQGLTAQELKSKSNNNVKRTR